MINNLFTIYLIFTLAIVGIFHFYWAFGGVLGKDKVIPKKDGKLLFNPSSILTFIVGILMFLFLYIAYIVQFYDLKLIVYGKYIIYSVWLLSGLFLLRAIGDFKTIGFFKTVKYTRFAKYDTRFFSPLVLSWAIIFALLAYQNYL